MVAAIPSESLSYIEGYLELYNTGPSSGFSIFYENIDDSSSSTYPPARTAAVVVALCEYINLLPIVQAAIMIRMIKYSAPVSFVSGRINNNTYRYYPNGQPIV